MDCGVKYAVPLMNGTAALHLALKLAGVGPGDQILVPDLTFVASVNAIRYTGAEPVLIDVEEESWQMDPSLFSMRSYPRLKAILPVHILGGMVNMESWQYLADYHGLSLIEDATEALGCEWSGKKAGSLGKMACLSFNGNKIMTSGGGGMLLTDSEYLAQKARHISTQAKTDALTYQHDAVGYNYRMVNLLAALGLAQFEQLNHFLDRRKQIFQQYRKHLQGVGDIRFQQHHQACTPNHWLTSIRTHQADALITLLLENNIQVRRVWTPMHELPMYADCSFISEKHISSQLHRECISLPSSVNLTEESICYVCDLIKRIY
ncbi:MAG: aminotransferase class I/II-fold pyridoxal phosphate-dependent enzyme [Bacteroidota bacterium]